MGVAGALNDFGDVTVNVYQYAPNDYGLYNMAGNVNEWVMDVYRPLSIQDNNEFRPFRGSVFHLNWSSSSLSSPFTSCSTESAASSGTQNLFPLTFVRGFPRLILKTRFIIKIESNRVG